MRRNLRRRKAQIADRAERSVGSAQRRPLGSLDD
jgi:hypothetical protein